MKRDLIKKNRAVVALVIFTLMAFIIPASAVQMTIDLDKTYQFREANVSTIESIDLGNLSLSEVEVLTTAGGNTDLQIIHTPVIRQLTRNFTSLVGTFNSVTITIAGENPSTVDLTEKPDFRIYTQPSVPTFSISAPDHTGNPFVTKYNESWVKGDTSDLSSLFRSSEGAYLYKTGGVAYINVTSGHYSTSGSVWDILESNLTYTLDKNKVADLGSFTAERTASYNLGEFVDGSKANTGKYYAGAMLHNQAEEKISIYAMSPIVVLKAPTPARWTNSSGTYTPAPFTYLKQSADDVTLDFSPGNPDLTTMTKVTYLFINDSAQYDIYMHIDTEKLAQNAENRWQTSFTPGTQIIDLLYEGIQNDVGTPFNYTMTAVGSPSPAPSTEWSEIAITPGFGISGRANDNSVTIPAANMSRLNPGLYDLYVMGTDANNNIVALDQVQVRVTTGTEIGVFRPSTHMFYLDYNGNGIWNGAVVDRAYNFGLTGDSPVAGDWNNDGKSEIGVFRPSTNMFYLDYNGNGVWNGASVDRAYNFGLTGDIPVAGDWNNDGKSEIGVFRNSTHRFYLDYNGNGLWNGPGVDRLYNFGLTGDLPVAGDWNNNGISEIGVFRPSRHLFYLDYNGNGLWNGTVVDRVNNFGLTNDLPIAGDWNNNGISEIGVFRPSRHLFYLDYNGNGLWNGTAIDRAYNFGLTGDLPVAGKWI